MKANEAPEKIYITLNFDRRYFSKKIDVDSVEYTRTDVFIEKADKWLSLNMKMLMNVFDVEYNTHDTNIEDFIEDFVKYMKGE